MQFLKKIKFNLQYNDLLTGLFREYLPKNPETDADRWTLEELELAGNSIEVGSVEGNLVSRHYRGMIHDDLVDKENSRTVDQIIKVIDWWKLAQSLLEADGMEIIIGTRWTFNDLYGHLLTSFLGKEFTDKEEEYRKQPVVEFHKDRYHYLRYLCWQDPVNEKGSTFPTLFPEERLKQLKEEQGEHFPGQYLNDPFLGSDSPFQRHWFVTWKEDQLPAQRVGIQLIDPIGKDTKISDYMGNVIVEAGSDRNIYVRYAQRDRKTDSDAVRWMIQTACIYQPSMICVEEFKFNTFRELAEFIVPQMILNCEVPKPLFEYVERIPYRMVELHHHSRPKMLRMTALTGWVKEGKVLFAPSGMQDLNEEMLRCGKTERDDLLDALAYILDVVIFPAPTDPPKYLVLPDEMKMTPEEKERKFWENLRDSNYADEGRYISDDDSLY
jgi:hypothetical protein